MRSVTETPYKLFSTYSETIPKVASITGFKTCVIEQRNHYEVRNHNEDRIFFYQWRAKSLSSLSSTHLMCESVECPQKWRNITAFSSTEYPCHSLHSSTPIKVWKCINVQTKKGSSVRTIYGCLKLNTCHCSLNSTLLVRKYKDYFPPLKILRLVILCLVPHLLMC